MLQLNFFQREKKISDFSFLQKSIADLLVVPADLVVTLASTHRSTILTDRNLLTLTSTFTRLLDIQLDLFIS